MWRWLVGLTPHELDILRTIAIIVGTGCVPVFGLILTWLAKAIRNNTNTTVKQTRTRKTIDGKHYDVSVADVANEAVHNTENLRGELTHLSNELPRLHGRRRNTPTNQIPNVNREDSHYD